MKLIFLMFDFSSITSLLSNIVVSIDDEEIHKKLSFMMWDREPEKMCIIMDLWPRREISTQMNRRERATWNIFSGWWDVWIIGIFSFLLLSLSLSHSTTFN